MNPISYYQEMYGHDLLKVANPHSTITYDNRISVVSLIPAQSYPTRFFEDKANEFQKIQNKTQFLFCFYFSTLIDQAIHASLRIEHAYFNNLARYPKLCGILGTFHTNLHPALLLLVATIYTSDINQSEVTNDLKELSNFFPDDYFRFLTKEYPSLSGRLRDSVEKERALLKLFTELSNATSILFLPRSLRPYTKSEPNLSLFEEWTKLIASCINEKLNNLKINHID